MKFVKLHSKTTSVSYRNSICSIAAFTVFFLALLSVIIPVFLVTVLSPYSGVTNARVLYEQPEIEFLYKYIFVGESLSGELITCSSFNYFNKLTQKYQACNRVQFSQKDINYDGAPDTMKFRLEIDSGEDFTLENFYFILFFDGSLKHKCKLKPPLVLLQEVAVPSKYNQNANVILKGQLELRQFTHFTCPYYGRKIKTHFQNDILVSNTSNIEDFSLKKVRERIRQNPGFFELQINEKYFKKHSDKSTTIEIHLDINEVGARYFLNIWEKLGQFWLYFASFFGISFYLCNKLKDFLFGRHILRSWEVIPWKKMY